MSFLQIKFKCTVKTIPEKSMREKKCKQKKNKRKWKDDGFLNLRFGCAILILTDHKRYLLHQNQQIYHLLRFP